MMSRPSSPLTPQTLDPIGDDAPPTLCERVAAFLLEIHRKTTPVAAIVLLGVAALSAAAYGFLVGNHHVMWGGSLVTVVSGYGFVLSGCERLLAARDRRIDVLARRLAESADSSSKTIEAEIAP